MADQLPIKSGTRAVDKTATTSTSLLGRGLAAIQGQQIGIVQLDLDARYRKARNLFNKIRDYGESLNYDMSGNFYYVKIHRDLFKSIEHLPLSKMLNQLAVSLSAFEELASSHYGKAYFPFAILCKNGQGISENIENANYYERLAFDWCYSVRDTDDPEILTDLGEMYDHGIGVQKDLQQAIFWYHKAAQRGYFIAQYYLARTLWEDGDELASFCWLKKSAKQGYANAQLQLGLTYIHGDLGAEKDNEKGLYWYRRAAEQGCIIAQLTLAEIYAGTWIYELFSPGEADEEAAFWYRKAAELGDPIAQSWLGKAYDEGWGVERNYKEAMLWYRKAVEQGYYYSDAQYRLLGILYDIEKNYEEAAFWSQKMAEKGNVKAQTHLGALYLRGKGVEKDLKKAIFWYSKAANQGYAQAQYILGWAHANGFGVGKDDVQAIFWYQKAAKQGHKEAQELLTARDINWTSE